MSAVRVTKIRDFDVTPPRKSAFQIETPPDVPRQHSLTIFSARRGGGKSVACTTYVKKLVDVGAMQRVIIITPTWASNKDIFAPLNIKEEDVIEPSKTSSYITWCVRKSGGKYSGYMRLIESSESTPRRMGLSLTILRDKILQARYSLKQQRNV